MASVKATMLFQQTTERGRVGGWSETWYKDGTFTAVNTALKALCTARANLLPIDSEIIGQRVQIPGGRAFTDNSIFPGQAAKKNDIPQMAAQCRILASNGVNAKIFSMRGVPDDLVVGGDLIPGAATPLYTAFGNRLGLDSWQIRSRDNQQPTAGIISIGIDGLFTLTNVIPFAVGDYLTLLHVKNTAGRAVTGNFYVKTVVNPTQGNFANWPGSAVIEVGKVRKLVYVFNNVDKSTFRLLRVMVRKVGRPFDLYRGRAPVRH